MYSVWEWVGTAEVTQRGGGWRGWRSNPARSQSQWLRRELRRTLRYNVTQPAARLLAALRSGLRPPAAVGLPPRRQGSLRGQGRLPQVRWWSKVDWKHQPEEELWLRPLDCLIWSHLARVLWGASWWWWPAQLSAGEDTWNLSFLHLRKSSLLCLNPIVSIYSKDCTHELIRKTCWEFIFLFLCGDFNNLFIFLSLQDITQFRATGGVLDPLKYAVHIKSSIFNNLWKLQEELPEKEVRLYLPLSSGKVLLYLCAHVLLNVLIWSCAARDPVVQ